MGMATLTIFTAKKWQFEIGSCRINVGNGNFEIFQPLKHAYTLYRQVVPSYEKWIYGRANAKDFIEYIW